MSVGKLEVSVSVRTEITLTCIALFIRDLCRRNSTAGSQQELPSLRSKQVPDLGAITYNVVACFPSQAVKQKPKYGMLLVQRKDKLCARSDAWTTCFNSIVKWTNLESYEQKVDQRNQLFLICLTPIWIGCLAYGLQNKFWLGGDWPQYLKQIKYDQVDYELYMGCLPALHVSPSVTCSTRNRISFTTSSTPVPKVAACL